MATKVGQYGLLEDDQGQSAPQGTGGTGANGQGNTAPTNPFAGSVQLAPVGAAAVIPEVAQYAFNPNYAAQNQALERAIADRGLQRSNQLGALEQDWTRQRGEADTTRAKALDQLIARYGSSGLIGSTIDAGSRQDLQSNFTKYLGQLDLAKANSQQGIQGDYGRFIADVNQQKAGMWGAQQRDEEAARIKAADDARQAKQAEDAANAQRYAAEQYAQAQRDAAARQPANPGYNPPYTPGVVTGGGGGGGGGGLGWNMGYAGIGPGDTMQDVQNQINALASAGGIHQLSLMYSAPEFQTPEMAGMKKALGQFIYNASSPGQPGYIPSNYSEPGGFY